MISQVKSGLDDLYIFKLDIFDFATATILLDQVAHMLSKWARASQYALDWQVARLLAQLTLYKAVKTIGSENEAFNVEE